MHRRRCIVVASILVTVMLVTAMWSGCVVALDIAVSLLDDGYESRDDGRRGWDDASEHDDAGDETGSNVPLSEDDAGGK